MDDVSGRMRGKTNNRPYTQEDVACPQRYCVDGNYGMQKIEIFCIPNRSCPTGQHFSNRLFSIGISSVDLQQYLHYINKGIHCMPVCIFGSNDSRMPYLEGVASAGNMSQWYNRYGRCPDFRPP